MAINYTNFPVDWDNEGVMPPQDLIENGFTAGYKPPAEYFNAILNRNALAIRELQNKTADFADNINTSIAKADTHVENASLHIIDATCTYADNVYALTLSKSVGNAQFFCVRFKAPNTFTSGSVFSLNGKSYTPVNAEFNTNDVVILNFDTVQTKCFFVTGGGGGAEITIATQAQATAGTDNTVLMTPLRVKQAIDATDFTTDVTTVITNKIATEAEAKAGTDNTKIMTPLRVATAITNKIATEAEATAGTDNTKIMTPLRVQNTLGKYVKYANETNDFIELNHHYSGSGTNTIQDCRSSVVCGYNNTINSGLYFSAILGNGHSMESTTHNLGESILAGEYHTASPHPSSAVGNGASWIYAFGYNNIASRLNFVVGKYNKTPTYSDPTANTGDLFIVGNGLSSSRTNAFRVTAAGAVMGTQSYTASGADYAEMFEWLDENFDNADRRGLFVTLDGEKIRLATADDDYILGVVSATPSVVADAHTDDWCKKWKTDIFGERLLDENGAWILNDDFVEEDNEKYVSRADRKEWAAVGMVGKLIVVDDGTCEVNGYCYPTVGGIATKTEKGFRVIARIDEKHIKVVVK